jgi:recombinational DNA repair protein (RecF pathway)
MGELINEFAPPHEADERMFRMLAACVDALAVIEGSERQLTRYFEVWLLRLSGLFPDLRSCAECGTALDDTTPTLVDAELNSRCGQCHPNVPSVFSPEVLSAVRASYQLSPLNFVRNRKLTDQEDSLLSALTHRLITRAIDRRPRTLVAANR